MNKFQKNIKAYFFDLDGTLLDKKNSKGNHVISEKNSQAIQDLKKQKITPIISTGRIGPFVMKILEEQKIDYAVTGNGSLIVNAKGKILKKEALTQKQVLLLLNIMKKYKIAVKVDGELDAYGCTSWLTSKLATKFGFIPQTGFTFELHKEHFKMVIFGKTKSKLKKIAKVINNEVKELSIVSSAHGWTLEITNEKATKGLGNKYVAENILKLNTKTETAHVGDTMNDSTTAIHQKLIAMKNSRSELKKMSDYIGPNYKNGGIAKIVDGEIKETKK